MPNDFTGFPAEGLRFMQDLSQNNTKDWFEANKATYVQFVQTPAIALVATLGARLQAHFPDVQYDTRTNGSGSLIRLHRDTRFSADKSPYKTNIAMMFHSGSGKKMASPGFGLQLTLEAVEVVAGVFGFEKPVLEHFRQAVLHDTRGAALDAAVAAVQQAGEYIVEGAEYKRVPKGYPADHPRAEWLKFTGLYVSPPPFSLEVAQTPALVDVLLTHFVNMAPVQRWLVDLYAGTQERE